MTMKIIVIQWCQNKTNQFWRSAIIFYEMKARKVYANCLGCDVLISWQDCNFLFSFEIENDLKERGYP